MTFVFREILFTVKQLAPCEGNIRFKFLQKVRKCMVFAHLHSKFEENNITVCAVGTKKQNFMLIQIG
jgi:hypothetical protein